ncbi:MAG: outer membrane lipoprotein-sorting protein, partial [Treponema sp.]|nr:outer membrane lipoprotein-sorting protein [Treponema sp.]
MKKIVLLFAASILGTVAFAAQLLTGYDIVKKAHDVPEPKTSSSTATLTIHSKKGSDRVREVIMKSKDYGDVKKEV